jgi:hypothetical protein
MALSTSLAINRALVYGSLTATLAIVYFGGVATVETIRGRREVRRSSAISQALLH